MRLSLIIIIIISFRICDCFTLLPFKYASLSACHVSVPVGPGYINDRRSDATCISGSFATFGSIVGEGIIGSRSLACTKKFQVVFLAREMFSRFGGWSPFSFFPKAEVFIRSPPPLHRGHGHSPSLTLTHHFSKSLHLCASSADAMLLSRGRRIAGLCLPRRPHPCLPLSGEFLFFYLLFSFWF